MKINIEQKTENLLLNRQEISFKIDHTGSATPPRSDVRAKLAALLNCQEDQLYITKLNGLYGQSTTQGYAHLYPSKEIALVQELEYIIKRHPTEEAAETPPAEKKTEEIESPPTDTETPPKDEPPKKKDDKAPMKEKKEEKPKKVEVPRDQLKGASKQEKKTPKETSKEEKAEKAP